MSPVETQTTNGAEPLAAPDSGTGAAEVKRERLVTWVTLFFVVNILVFAAACQAGLRIGIPYVLWVGIFNVMAIAQFWAFANDIFTPEKGKLLGLTLRRKAQQERTAEL